MTNYQNPEKKSKLLVFFTDSCICITVMAVLAVSAISLLVFFLVSRRGEAAGCDLYKGTWVYDKSYPLYQPEVCPFIEKEFNCLKNGRNDRDYLSFRWQPAGCPLPRFNGQDFLRRMRGKRMMFVGDSLSLNQWQSLTCMLHYAAPHSNFTISRKAGLSTFFFPEYSTSIEFSRNAFLVDIVGTPSGRVLEIDTISSGPIWKNADVLIFNSWHWWLHSGRKQAWDIVREGNKTYRDTDRLVLYEKALRTWATWIDTHVDPSRTKVFFQGISPDHASSSPNGTNCIGATKPIPGVRYPGGPHPAEVVVQRVLRTLKNPKAVKLLDVTLLSQLRKDGHPSFFGFGGHRAADCSHWCLPGVPDTWNQLLYAEFLP